MGRGDGPQHRLGRPISPAVPSAPTSCPSRHSRDGSPRRGLGRPAGPRRCAAIPAPPGSIAEFIEAHLLMLEDAALVDAVRDLIRQLCSAEWACSAPQRPGQVFDAMEDPYLRTRRDDVDQVVFQILALLGGGPRPAGLAGRGLDRVHRVADDLARRTPSCCASGGRRLGHRVRRAHVPHRHPGAQPRRPGGGRRAQRHPLCAHGRDAGGGRRDRHRAGRPGHRHARLLSRAPQRRSRRRRQHLRTPGRTGPR